MFKRNERKILNQMNIPDVTKILQQTKDESLDEKK